MWGGGWRGPRRSGRGGTSALRHASSIYRLIIPGTGWGAQECTLGPQAKLIHLPSFSPGSEVAAARSRGRGKKGKEQCRGSWLCFLGLDIASSFLSSSCIDYRTPPFFLPQVPIHNHPFTLLHFSIPT